MGWLKRTVGAGTWRPATLTSGDTITLKITLAVIALSSAADYLFVVVDGRGDAIEHLGPVGMWSVICATVGLLLLIGIAFRAHGLVFAGHFLGASAYMALTAGAIQHAVTLVPPDEWRRAGPLLVVALLHGMFALRSGPTPLEGQQESTVETVVAPADS